MSLSMKPRLDCPHCGNPAVSVLSKMNFSPAAPKPCKACDKDIEIPADSLSWLGWVGLCAVFLLSAIGSATSTGLVFVLLLFVWELLYRIFGSSLVKKGESVPRRSSRLRTPIIVIFSIVVAGRLLFGRYPWF